MMSVIVDIFEAMIRVRYELCCDFESMEKYMCKIKIEMNCSKSVTKSNVIINKGKHMCKWFCFLYPIFQFGIFSSWIK